MPTAARAAFTYRGARRNTARDHTRLIDGLDWRYAWESLRNDIALLSSKVKARGRKHPSNGTREVARRARQIAAGHLTVANGLSA